MNKFADWMKANEKNQRGVAAKLGISTSSLHDILRKNQTPNLKVAYKIEIYTKGSITLYDWIDEKKNVETIEISKKTKATKKIKTK